MEEEDESEGEGEEEEEHKPRDREEEEEEEEEGGESEYNAVRILVRGGKAPTRAPYMEFHPRLSFVSFSLLSLFPSFFFLFYLFFLFALSFFFVSFYGRFSLRSYLLLSKCFSMISCERA